MAGGGGKGGATDSIYPPIYPPAVAGGPLASELERAGWG
jgi:hypothetical protein